MSDISTYNIFGIELSPKRQIEVRYKQLKEKTFGAFLKRVPSLKQKKEIERCVEDILQTFNARYAVVKDKFKNKKRDSGERYFNHLLGVSEIYINIFSNIDKKLDTFDFSTQKGPLQGLLTVMNEVNRVIIALEHDTIEDTDTTFESLSHDIGKENAFAVLLLSKQPFYNFIEDESDKKKMEVLNSMGITNKKGTLEEKIQLKIELENSNITHIEKIATFGNENYELIESEKLLLKIYYDLKEKYKEKSDTDYYKNWESYASFKKYAEKLGREHEIFFDNEEEEELDHIIQNAIYVKICDRLHNLGDMIGAGGRWTDEKIEKKLQETEKSILKITKEINPEAYELLKKKINEIREYLANKKLQNTKGKVQQAANETLQNS